MMPDVVMKSSVYTAAEGADAVAIVTEWDAFHALDLARLGATMTDKLLVDLRKIYRRDEVARHISKHNAIGARDE
jgi:UDPglucose 6-dehydrogenase